MANLLSTMMAWREVSPLVRRAVVAALCEPQLLAEQENARRIIDLIDGIPASILEE